MRTKRIVAIRLSGPILLPLTTIAEIDAVADLDDVHGIATVELTKQEKGNARSGI